MDYPKAIACLEEALVDDPENDLYLRDLGECFMEREEYKTAIEYLEKASQANPGRDWTWFSLGKCYASIGDHGKAVEALLRNLEGGPLDPLLKVHTYYYLAVCYSGLGQKEEALENYEKMIQNNENVRGTESAEQKALRKSLELL